MKPKCPACGTGSWTVGFSRSGYCCFKCKSCGRKFNERAGTPFHGLVARGRKVCATQASAIEAAEVAETEVGLSDNGF